MMTDLCLIRRQPWSRHWSRGFYGLVGMTTAKVLPLPTAEAK